MFKFSESLSVMKYLLFLFVTCCCCCCCCVKAAPQKNIEKKVWPLLHQYNIWETQETKITTQTNNQNDLQYQNNVELSDTSFPLLTAESSAAATALAQKVETSNNNGSNNKVLRTVDVNSIDDRQSKGIVLSFFPHPNEEECLSTDGRRYGTCMNVYECRKRGGQGKGECALGFGVCCIFVMTCDQEIKSNITYLISPNFPSFMPSNNLTECRIKINLISSDISQLRIDFNHMLLGQPNRKSGICDGDSFQVSGGPGGPFKICGQNSGQHVYYDVVGLASRQSPSVTTTTPPVAAAAAGPLATLSDTTNNTIMENLMNDTMNPTQQQADEQLDQGLEILINFTRNRIIQNRFWELRILQIPFSQRAPSGCLQYFDGNEGFIQTFNFADNGRHLANQNYRSCIRQERNMCSIIYEPCDENSFRIGPNNPDDQQSMVANDFATTMSTPQLNTLQADSATVTVTPSTIPTTSSTLPTDIQADPVVEEEEIDGSGDNAAILADSSSASPSPSTPVRGGFDIFSFFRSTFFNYRNAARQQQQSYRNGRQFFQKCTDRITMPCIVEDFIGKDDKSMFPDCEPIHCGMSFCLANGGGNNNNRQCRVESTVKPFYLGVHFGDGEGKGSPEENIGACLRYSQVACM